MQRWPRAAGALPGLVIAGLLVDGLPNELPMMPRPEERPNHTAADLRLDLPLGPDFDTIALFRATAHGRPLLNGYSGYFAPHYWSMRRLLRDGDARVVERLSSTAPSRSSWTTSSMPTAAGSALRKPCRWRRGSTRILVTRASSFRAARSGPSRPPGPPSRSRWLRHPSTRARAGGARRQPLHALARGARAAPR